MDDIFKEQLVKRHTTSKDITKKVAMLVVALIPIFIIYTIIPITIMLLAPAYAFFVYVMLSTVQVEYEYVLTNTDLDIDIIYNKKRRKNLFSGSLKDIEIMAHIEDKNHEGIFNTAVKTKDCSSGVTKENTYAFFIAYKGERTKFIIEPDEDFLQIISRTLIRTKFYRKK